MTGTYAGLEVPQFVEHDFLRAVGYGVLQVRQVVEVFLHGGPPVRVGQGREGSGAGSEGFNNAGLGKAALVHRLLECLKVGPQAFYQRITSSRSMSRAISVSLRATCSSRSRRSTMVSRCRAASWLGR